ncbi:hypothetical protein ARMGADRAFT_1013345 [Armillaria gallica]|uniref:Uncharacterized protein n=1 Tax=Armillaria gallica TaxID=47427 RepID=A0A2H3DXB6_ARMGA|nr:hypothetical protein ARMGADRAFT_1013345 [Armillaria gallica]
MGSRALETCAGSLTSSILLVQVTDSILKSLPWLTKSADAGVRKLRNRLSWRCGNENQSIPNGGDSEICRF